MRNDKKEKLWDLVAASPVILWFGVGAAGCLSKILSLLDARGDAIAVFAQFVSAFFFLLAITLLIIRRPAIRKANGIGPKLAGILGCVTPLMDKDALFIFGYMSPNGFYTARR